MVDSSGRGEKHHKLLSALKPNNLNILVGILNLKELKRYDNKKTTTKKAIYGLLLGFSFKCFFTW